MHGVPVDAQHGRVVAKGLAQPVQRQAQVGQRVPVVHLRPKQSGQAVAAVRVVGFYSEIGQQCPDFVGAEGGEGTAVVQNLEGTQEVNLQIRHRFHSIRDLATSWKRLCGRMAW